MTTSPPSGTLASIASFASLALLDDGGPGRQRLRRQENWEVNRGHWEWPGNVQVPRYGMIHL